MRNRDQMEAKRGLNRDSGSIFEWSVMLVKNLSCAQMMPK